MKTGRFNTRLDENNQYTHDITNIKAAIHLKPLDFC